MANFWRSWFRSAKPDPNQAEREVAALLKQTPVPTLWLFGKTGSGKSSIVRYLTGAEAATIGEGFRPETKTSRRYDFPSSKDPLLTFLDTRGLGEAAYDPQPDINQFTKSTQLMIVTVRATDHALDGLVEPLKRFAQRILNALCCSCSLACTWHPAAATFRRDQIHLQSPVARHLASQLLRHQMPLSIHCLSQPLEKRLRCPRLCKS